MKILERPIAITDVETTGLDPTIQEIIEVGLVLVNQQTLEIIDTLDVKVRPKHLETATEFALKLNGYNAIDWHNALALQAVMLIYSAKAKDAIFCAHNVTFDWSFILKAFNKTGVENLMDYHPIDLFTMALMKLRNSGLEKFNMNEVAKYLGIPEEPMPHRAINGAMTAYEIYKRLVS
ncbi:MAG: 3'-5' exonuclease [Candidatus Brennerbacteria bacterium]|nr:3'-5' exonuclease [Candidatus Brennerbacteria bacterium]